MALYKLSESVRLVPYYADMLGGVAVPNDDGELDRDELMLDNSGRPRVFNMPVGGLKALVYTEAGDLDSLDEEKREEYDRIVYSPFPQHWEQLEKRKLSNLDGEYSAAKKLEPKKAASRGRAAQEKSE